MAPKVHSNWFDHGWWIVGDNPEEPTLWITEFPVEEGRYWAALGTSFGVIKALAGTVDGGQTVTVINTESGLEKYKLRKKLMLSPVPPELFLVLSPMHGLKPLVKFWRNMPEELQVQRETRIQKFKESNREQILQTRARYIEIRSYEDLRINDAVGVENQAPPREPEDTDETYRLLAAPVKENWIPVSERSRKRAGTSSEVPQNMEEGGVSERQRAHRQRLQSTSTDDIVQPLPESENQQHESALVQEHILLLS